MNEDLTPMKTRMMKTCNFNTKVKGFTLIELMIVVAVIAIIAAIGYPSYINSIVKTKRAAAEGCVSQYAGYMERFYTQNLRYDQDTSTDANPVVGNAPTLTLDCAGPQSSGADYVITVAAPTASTYTVTATPRKESAQFSRDTACGALSIDQAGTKAATGTMGAACW
jgi:type IV pilus assembly protein PilE